MLLLGLGDSVTDGLGARKGWSYFDRLITTPADEVVDLGGLSLSAVFPNLRATNLALSGSTSLQHWDREFRRLPTVESNTWVIVTMTTGGNDLIQRYGKEPPREGAMYGATWEQAQPWVTNFEQRLEQMIQRLNETYPGRCEIFLANVYDPTDGLGSFSIARLPHWPDGPRLLRAYNDNIARCAGRHVNVHLVDLHQSFLGHGFRCAQFWSAHYRRDDPHFWYYLNIEDPNERGYDAIRRLFLNEMIAVFAPR